VSARRFFFSGPKDGILHRVHSDVHVEGELTDCGITLRKGWRWMHRRQGARICKRCDAAA
jgi:hypothetical protein